MSLIDDEKNPSRQVQGNPEKVTQQAITFIDSLPRDPEELARVLPPLIGFLRDIRVLTLDSSLKHSIDGAFQRFQMQTWNSGRGSATPDGHFVTIESLLHNTEPTLDERTYDTRPIADPTIKFRLFPSDYTPVYLGIREAKGRDMSAEHRLRQDVLSTFGITDAEFLVLAGAVEFVQESTQSDEASNNILPQLFPNVNPKAQDFIRMSQQLLVSDETLTDSRRELLTVMVHALIEHRQGMIDVSSEYFKRMMKEVFPLLPTNMLDILESIANGEVRTDTNDQSKS